MRAVIRTQVESGVPDQQILDGFVASYGENILVDPPKRGASLGVWVGPLVALAAGAALLAALARRWSRNPPARSQPVPLSASYAVDAELRRFREGA
jgi:cytochrome c-type biogenesis protein CcmH